MDRIAKICSLLSETETFADVGCDHGYMAEYMLKNCLCRTAYITDISEKCLKKAETLLDGYIRAGKCIPVVCDGLAGVPKDCGFVLIAGMGGEEIVRILSESFLPKKFLFQPMKNSEKLRRYLAARGAMLERDFTFSDGTAFYDVILGQSEGGGTYTEEEFFFGRENLRSPSADFIEKWESEAAKLRSYLERDNMAAPHREDLTSRLTRIETLLDKIRLSVF